MTVLVTGAAGYVGSVTVDLLLERGVAVVGLDDLSRGHCEAVAPSVPFYQGEAGDAVLVRRIVATHAIDACMHFAGLSIVSESLTQPVRYLAQNVAQALSLVQTLHAAGVGRLVFSSSAAVYGEPAEIPIPERHPLAPTHPYGASKRLVESVLEYMERSCGMRYVSLRYFNAAGATMTRGEDHDPETHLIPLVLRAAAGEADHVPLFGDDYGTPDGTAIRDYVHVSDLAEGHVRALELLRGSGESIPLNLGSGVGRSVREVIAVAETVTRRPIPVVVRPRRDGDPSRLVADVSQAGRVLGWAPKKSALDQIIASAWEWRLRNPSGYHTRAA